MRYKIYGVEHVYDEFDVYEHPNTCQPIEIEARSVEEARSKGRQILQSIITDTRRDGGFLQTGTFDAEVVLILNSDGKIAWRGRESHTIDVGFGNEIFPLQPHIEFDPPSMYPERELDLEYRTYIPADDGKPGKLLIETDIGLIHRIALDPQAVYMLSPRKFEELIAEILKEFDFDVKLSPLGPDGGIDIFAERAAEFGPELYLVQCKRHRRDRRVGLPIIKQLNADLRDRRASRGLLVTTSYFTKPALSYIEQAKYRLSGADFDVLLGWLNKIRTNV